MDEVVVPALRVTRYASCTSPSLELQMLHESVFGASWMHHFSSVPCKASHDRIYSGCRPTASSYHDECLRLYILLSRLFVVSPSSACSSSIMIWDYYENKILFVTGGTGFVGTTVLYRLLSQAKPKHVYVLCRGGLEYVPLPVKEETTNSIIYQEGKDKMERNAARAYCENAHPEQLHDDSRRRTGGHRNNGPDP